MEGRGVAEDQGAMYEMHEAFNLEWRRLKSEDLVSSCHARFSSYSIVIQV